MDIAKITGWETTPSGLYRKFIFKDFNDAFAFMIKVSHLVEQADHHPTWTNTYNKVEIWLVTHDQGNQISTKDTTLAQAINALIK